MGAGGKGGGGGFNDYSGGRKNVGFWSPGGGKVPSYDKGGSQNDRSPGQQPTNFMKQKVTFPAPTTGPARKASPQGFRPAEIGAGAQSEQQRLSINMPGPMHKTTSPPAPAKQFSYPPMGPPMRRPGSGSSNSGPSTALGGSQLDDEEGFGGYGFGL